MGDEAVPLPDAALVRGIVEAALAEDGADRDVTTQALIAEGQRGGGEIVAKEEGVLAGLLVAEAAFAALHGDVRFEALLPDGAALVHGNIVARVEGPLAPILSAERVALNFLQRLSGVATAARRLVEAVAGTNTRIVDTRKTTPGLRALERYAVRVGGAQNHRFNLADGVLIKDNHLAAARARGLAIEDVIRLARQAAPRTLAIEVEVTAVAEAEEALAAGADAILLDNMAAGEMRRVAEMAKGKAVLEASGGVTLENVRSVADTGVDVISVGAITHSAPALDMSLDVEVA